MIEITINARSTRVRRRKKLFATENTSFLRTGNPGAFQPHGGRAPLRAVHLHAW
jgi:hypothetical protein